MGKMLSGGGRPSKGYSLRIEGNRTGKGGRGERGARGGGEGGG